MSAPAWLLRDGEVLAALEVADTRRDRRRGLLGRDGIDGALLLRPARSVHTFRMRFAIDVAFCDRNLVVLGTCTMARDGNRWVATCSARTRAVFPEINDAQPAGAVLWRARFSDQGRAGAIPRGSTGDCSIPVPRGNLANYGIDHILISASLKQRLTSEALVMRAVNYADDTGQPLRAARDRALPSDHCPHVVTWTTR